MVLKALGSVRRWASKALKKKDPQGYYPLATGNGRGWEPESSSSNSSGSDIDWNFSRQPSPPPKVILGEYTYHSTIAQDIIHLYVESATGTYVVAKEAPLREANIHRKLAGHTQRHPNIVQFIDTASLQGETETFQPGKILENFLLLMEFSNGGCWQQLFNFAMTHNHVLPARFSYHILRSALDGLMHMQASHGMVHTDAHLGNLTFDIRNGRVHCLLIDFEASEVVSREDPSPSFALTAREILRNGKAFPQDVLHCISFAADRKTPTLSLDVLHQLKSHCLAKAGGLECFVNDLPEWLVQYFDMTLSRSR